MTSLRCLQRVKLKLLIQQLKLRCGGSTRSLNTYKPPIGIRVVLDQESHAGTFIANMSYQNTAHALEFKEHRPFSSSSFANNVAVGASKKNSDAVSIDELQGEDKFLVTKYKEMARVANVMLDEHQIVALVELDRLRNDILSSNVYTNETKGTQSSIGDNEEDEPFFPFMNKFSSIFGQASSKPLLNSNEVHKGVYLHGGVGCGKTFCMRLFYDTLPIASKQFVHFHKFMLTLHRQMHEAKMIDGIKGDVLPAVIDRIIEKGMVIAFDEFQVTDVADALILRRLFTGLLDKGAVIIATSNRPPSDLYLNGLQRDLFLPFIKSLEEKNEIVSMWDSETDYRLVQGANKARGVYFIGDNKKSDFDESFKQLTKGSFIGPTTLTTQGRIIQVPKASLEYHVAKFSFGDLCRKARGAADYLLIGESFHTVFIEDIPVLNMNDVNLVRRFIVFVDAMYECNVKLIVHAETSPEGIFQVDLANRDCDEVFAFDRTQSRLQEMGSNEYLRSRWTGQKADTD